MLSGDERNVSELKEIASVALDRDMVQPGENIALEHVALLGNTDDRSIHVNVRPSFALRRVVNPIKPDTRTSRRNRRKIDSRDRRESRATRREDQGKPDAGSQPDGCGSAFSGHEGSTLPPTQRIDGLPTRCWLCRNAIEEIPVRPGRGGPRRNASCRSK